MTGKEAGFLSGSLRFWNVLVIAGVVGCVATVFGFFGRFSWFLDVFSHFRVQYLFGLLALGLIFFFGRRRRVAVTFFVFAFVNFVLIVPLYFGRQHKPADGAPALRAMLINVNTHSGDFVQVGDAITTVDPDILVLEEISARWMADLVWLTNVFSHSLVQPRDDNFGIGLFSKFPLADAEVVYITDAEVPSIVASVNLGHTNLRVVATHPLPPGGRDYSRLRNEQLEQLPDYVRSPLPVLLLGDLNTTPWNYYFRRFLSRSRLRDSAKGYGVQPTWPNFMLLLRIPIDHCLHSPGIIILDRRIGDDVASDHYPLIVDFTIASPKKD